MIGIRAIASFLPDGRIDNKMQAQAFGEPLSFIEEKIGAHTLPVKEDSWEASDLGLEAVDSLCKQHGLELSTIDALICVTQNPDGYGLPHSAAILQGKLGLASGVAAFDISLGCSGFVYGISVLRGLMLEMGYKNGVLVTADPYSRIISRQDRVTSLLFGDAATATWLSNEVEWSFRNPILETDGTGSQSLFVDETRTLRMNGRQVFNFAAVRVPQQINSFLKRENLSEEDIELFCLHQGSGAVVDAISRRFPSVRERFVKDIVDTGNTVSSSIPLLLEKYVMGSNLNKVLISGFGVGLSWATNLIERDTK